MEKLLKIAIEGEGMKTTIKKTVECLPCHPFCREKPCMVCQNKSAGFRASLRYHDKTGNQYAIIIIDCCFDCVDLCGADMVRKISHQNIKKEVQCEH